MTTGAGFEELVRAIVRDELAKQTASPAPMSDDRVLMAAEVAERFPGLKKSTVLRAHRLGQLKAVRVGSRGVRFQVPEIRAFLARRKA